MWQNSIFVLSQALKNYMNASKLNDASGMIQNATNAIPFQFECKVSWIQFGSIFVLLKFSCFSSDPLKHDIFCSNRITHNKIEKMRLICQNFDYLTNDALQSRLKTANHIVDTAEKIQIFVKQHQALLFSWHAHFFSQFLSSAAHITGLLNKYELEKNNIPHFDTLSV